MPAAEDSVHRNPHHSVERERDNVPRRDRSASPRRSHPAPVTAAPPAAAAQDPAASVNYPQPPPAASAGPSSLAPYNHHHPPSYDMQRNSSTTSSIDSGYATGHPSQAMGSTSIYGPTRQYSASKTSPKTFPRVRLTNPEPRPINETRQACIPCRRKKVGCDLRQPGNDYEPPCKRCVTEGVRCVFPGSDGISNESTPQSLPSLSQLACTHCSQVFLKEEELRNHLRLQCQEKQYICATCGARFRRLNDLDRHTRIHTGERPHVCDICMRRFSRATTLTRHRQGPDGCAGRRADLGRRRLGSFQGPPPAETTPAMLNAQPKSS